jgi:SET domain-containing protein 6
MLDFCSQAIKEDRTLIQQDWRECYGILKDLYGEKFLENWFTLEHFLAAKTLVASRAFQVDDIHGFGMVPLADLYASPPNCIPAPSVFL